MGNVRFCLGVGLGLDLRETAAERLGPVVGRTDEAALVSVSGVIFQRGMASKEKLGKMDFKLGLQKLMPK